MRGGNVSAPGCNHHTGKGGGGGGEEKRRDVPVVVVGKEVPFGVFDTRVKSAMKKGREGPGLVVVKPQASSHTRSFNDTIGIFCY